MASVMTSADGAEDRLSPTPLLATTVKVYLVAERRPTTLVEKASPATLRPVQSGHAGEATTV